jgi:hypothetical protein
MMKCAKFFLASMLVLGLFVGGAHAATGDGCIVAPTTYQTVAQEAACTCYYNNEGSGTFGTLLLPEIQYQFGKDYTCGTGETTPLGNSGNTITFTLTASAEGNCAADQHPSETAPWPRFRNVPGYNLQTWDASASQWTCNNVSGTPIWTKTAGGDNYNYVTFKINTAAAGSRPPDSALPANKFLPGGGNPFVQGTKVRMIESCAYTQDGPQKFPIDSCTLCTNCSTVTITQSGTAECSTPDSTCSGGSKAKVIFDSVNQYASATIPATTVSGVGFFNGVIDWGYSKTHNAIGFKNEPTPTWEIDNWTDSFRPCISSNSFCCANYCCYPPGQEHQIAESLLIKQTPTFTLELTASKPWDAEGNQIGVKICRDASNNDSMCATGACTYAAGSFVATCVVDSGSLKTKLNFNWDASDCDALYIFATVDQTHKIIRRSFALSKMQFLYTAGTGMGKYASHNPLDFAPPTTKRYAGEWNMNAYQYIVPFIYAASDYNTRCFINNKSLYDAMVYADVFTAQACNGSADKCLATIAGAENLGAYTITPNTLKRIDFNTVMTPYSWVGGAEVAGTSVTLPVAFGERYSILLTVTADPQGQGSGEFASPQEVTVTCIQRDKNTTGWRTVNVLQSSSGNNAWQQ